MTRYAALLVKATATAAATAALLTACSSAPATPAAEPAPATSPPAAPPSPSAPPPSSSPTSSPGTAAPGAPSAEATFVAPAAKSCPDVVKALAKPTGVPWQLTDDTTAAGTAVRTCAARSTKPAAQLRIALHRTDPEVDTPETLLDAAQQRTGTCSTPLADPPDGVGYAVSCAGNGTATTTFVLESGWVWVEVAADEGDAFATTASRKAAVSSLSLM
ncbi:hypothetical protein [Actinoplanes sp. RD1]|uniref:hypothetical protein n=1 Tax=Actinoplanes sp. RD1 TaxID=3064538 RepID=UPI002741C169|nr:hypothetical protein [Actinoplanes sp. RD1]